MPVFDFSGASASKAEAKCTYTTFHSNNTHPSPEQPIIVLDNKERQWKHHSCGVFTNPVNRTAFEFKEEDGTYTAEVTLEGGSGRASIESPATLTVKDGKVTASIVWSSPNYDYMIVDGEKLLPVNTEGNSVFEIPVASFDTALDVIADTVAMSKPHEIEYTLAFDSSTIKTAE